jgi:hypothetical protein
VFLNGRQSVLPMHGTQELGKGLEAAIKRQPDQIKSAASALGKQILVRVA